MADFIFSKVSAYHWAGSYRKPETTKVNLDYFSNGIRTTLLSAAWTVYYPTDFIYRGLRLFTGHLSGRHISVVNDRSTEYWKRRWVVISCDRLLMPEADYQRLLKKMGRTS